MVTLTDNSRGTDNHYKTKSGGPTHEVAHAMAKKLENGRACQLVGAAAMVPGNDQNFTPVKKAIHHTGIPCNAHKRWQCCVLTSIKNWQKVTCKRCLTKKPKP